MVVGGEVMETSKLTINRAMKSADYYEWLKFARDKKYFHDSIMKWAACNQ